MRILEPRAAERRNLAETYVAIGSQIEGASVHPDPGYLCCLGPLAHAICNFGVLLDCRTESFHRLLAFVGRRPTFYVYAIADEPTNETELKRLRREALDEGFLGQFQLVQMRYFADSTADISEAVWVCESASAREAVAHFMAEQFFQRLPGPMRRQIASATAASRPNQLYRVEHRGRIVAGFLLRETENQLGLYNVCVEAGSRGTGLGKAIVHHAKAIAASRQLPLSLQCDGRLANWYEALGFFESGSAEVFARMAS